jgi:hypothetical protein
VTLALVRSTRSTAPQHERRPGILNGDIAHLSVFAIARLPLLVYLGSKIDDGLPADIYQRHRSTESWLWPQIEYPGTDFGTTFSHGEPSATEGVLITNLSGTTPISELPGPLRGLPIWTLAPTTGPAEDIFAHPVVLDRYTTTIRAYFTDLEATHKQLRNLHLIGALPLSGALTFGRVLKSAGLRPTIITYDRTDDGYRRALEV